MVGECSGAVKDPCSPGLSAIWARLAHQNAPLVDRPAYDQSAAVRAVAEGVRLHRIALEVFEGGGDQFLDVRLRVAGFLHGADGVEQAVKCFAMARHEAFLFGFSAWSQLPRNRWLCRLLAAKLRPLGPDSLRP